MIRTAFDRFWTCLRMAAKVNGDQVGYLHNSLVLSWEDEHLVLTASSRRTRLVCHLPAEGDLDSDATVEVADVLKELKKAKGHVLSIELHTRKKGAFLELTLDDQKHKVDLQDEASEDGPKPRRGSLQRGIIYPAGYFLETVGWLFKARSSGNHNTSYNSYCNSLIIDGERLAVTDGHRKHVQCGAPMSPFSSYLPTESVEMIMLALKDLKSAQVEVTHHLSRGKKAYEVLVTHLPPGESAGPDIYIYNELETKLPESLWKVLPGLDDALWIVINHGALLEALKVILKRKGKAFAATVEIKNPDTGEPVFYYNDGSRKEDDGHVSGVVDRLNAAPWQNVGARNSGYNPRFLLDAIGGLCRESDNLDDNGQPKANPLNFILTYNHDMVPQFADDGETELPPKLEINPGPLALSGQIPGRYALLMGLRDYWD